MRARANRQSERGVALILSILVIFILTVLGLALLFTTSTEFQIAGAETTINKTFYAADSGSQYGIYQARSQTTTPTSSQACTSPTNYFCFELPELSTAATDRQISVQVSPPKLVNVARSTSGGGSLNVNATPVLLLDYAFTSTSQDSTLKSQKTISVITTVGPVPGTPMQNQ